MTNLNYNDLISFLNTSLKEAEDIKSRFKNNLPVEQKQVIAKNFQNEILCALDYMYTNFPEERKLLGGYFPRPLLTESHINYTDRIKNFRNRNKTIIHPKKIVDFLQLCYEINREFQFAVSYIDSKVKHEKPNQFNEELTKNLDATIFSNHPQPIQFVNDSLNVAGIVAFHKDATVSLKDMSFIGNGFSTHVESLEYKEISISGGNIVFKNGDEFFFIDWASNCINICEQVFVHFKQSF